VNKSCDILIVGGGTGGCAAALAAAAVGCRVILTEVTDWIGGQLTAQIVPPDEHAWIEQFGCTARYRGYRDGVRQYYRDHYPLIASSRFDPHLNPGQGNVSAFAHEPKVGLAVLEQMMAYYRSRGLIEVRLRRRPVAVEMEGDRARSVTLLCLENGKTETIEAPYILDATELGDLLPLSGTEYVTGAESQKETSEPNAVAGPAQPDNVQSFTWCFPMAYDPQGEHVIDRPAQYDFWRAYEPQLQPAYPGRLLSWASYEAHSRRANTQTLFLEEGKNCWTSLWLYRRIVASQHYAPGAMPHEVTLVNWPQNDYYVTNIIDKPEAVVERALEESRQLSLSLLYWMQTEAPRPDGGVGYPGLYLRPDLTETADGLAKYPYIRESRRIRAMFTVTENHIAVEARKQAFAEPFADSVGIGHYGIDLHPTTGGDNTPHRKSHPFQIPLGALLPVRVENLLPAAKNLGVTHITNGAYRLHPVEWNIGEAAGLLAAFSLARKVPPRAVREQPALFADFQDLLVSQGIELAWPWAARVG
jgi:hypothetical protein